MMTAVATRTRPDTAVETRTLQTTETLKIALAQVVSIPLSRRILASECFDFVSAKVVKERRLSYETFAASSKNGSSWGDSISESLLPVLKPGRTSSSSKTLSVLEAMLITLQPPNELHGVQIHVYEDQLVARELVEIHTVRLESNKVNGVNDEQMALYNLLYSLNAYSFRLPNFKGKMTIKLFLTYTAHAEPESDPKGFEVTRLSDLPSVHITARDGFDVHEEIFPSLDLRRKTMRVHVEHLQPNANTQETTQGSIRDSRTEKFLKAVSQDMNTPTGGDPTQQRPSQDWGDEHDVQAPIKPAVRCPCGSSSEDPGMMQCKSCKTRQHAGCYGHLHFNSPGVVVDHICWLCVFGEALKVDEKRQELCDMARLRRAMSAIWTYGFVNEKTLAAQLDCSQTNAHRIVECLVAWHFLEETPRTMESKKAFSIPGAGQERDRFLKWFIAGHTTHQT